LKRGWEKQVVSPYARSGGKYLTAWSNAEGVQSSDHIQKDPIKPKEKGAADKTKLPLSKKKKKMRRGKREEEDATVGGTKGGRGG